jgi:hypothetical protein
MDLQGDVGQMEAHLGPFGDSVNLHSRLVHSLRRTCNRLENGFGHTQWNSYMMWVRWKLILVHLEIVLVSVQDWCLELLGNVGQMEDRFNLFRGSINLNIR